MTPPAYRLEWNYFYHRPDDIICRIVEFPGWDQSTRLAAIKPRFQPSEPVRFDTHFALLEDAPDYPNNTARGSHLILHRYRPLDDGDGIALAGVASFARSRWRSEGSDCGDSVSSHFNFYATL